MEITLSDHAQVQCTQRDISYEDIVHCVNQPAMLVRQSDGRLRVSKKIKRKGRWYALIVVYEEKSIAFIITAFISSNVKKYLI